MSRKDISIERLIVSRLDDALSEDEGLTLDRELIRNPEARSLLDDYKRIDELASSALKHALDSEQEPLDFQALPPRRQSPARRPSHRGWWLASGAVAAALLAIVVARMSTTPSMDRAITDNRPIPPALSTPAMREQPGVMRNASTRPRIRRNTGREIFGVIGDDGNIYWIEVDRTRTFRRPKLESGGRLVAGEL